MSNFAIPRFFLLASLAAMALAFSAPAKAEDVTVRVQKNDAAFEVRAEFTVPATVTETWEVVTDYDNMAKIVSTVDSSKIQKDLGWRAEHDFASGLRATVRWYLGNADWCASVQSGKYQRERLGQLK
jgi:dTDP-D-glucose 4,6-dehydratase